MSAHNKHFVKLDKIEAGKLCIYRRLHVNNKRLSLSVQ